MVPSAQKKQTELGPRGSESALVALDVRDVSIRLGRFHLQRLSFTAAAPHITAILGPNGSGKTTLLRIVSGELKTETGGVHLNGENVHAWSHRHRARQMALVAQESALHFPMTVLEYCLLARHPFLDGLRLASSEDLEIVRWALEETQARVFEDRWMDELSGGERQRVILARALAQTPRLLLLDEPTLNLDVAFQMRLLELVDRLARGRGLAVIMVTHELNLAAEFAHRVLLLRRGSPLAFGAPRDVLRDEHLKTLFESELMVDENPVTGALRVTLLRSAKPGKRLEE